MQSFNLDLPWRLHPQVAVRPEPFGALLYHFGTRRLSFLKDVTLLEIVQQLRAEPSAGSACTSAGVQQADLPRYQRALGALASSNMVIERRP